MNTLPSSSIDPSWQASSIPKGGTTIMIVDDDPAVLMVGKAMLSTLPYAIVGAPSGEDALEKLKALIAAGRRPDVIILDLTMPGGISGLETLQEIRLIDSKIGIIACSGFFEQSAHELCVALGFMECIEKPYTSELLTSTVRKCVTKLTEPAHEPVHEPEGESDPFNISLAYSSSRSKIVDPSS